MITIPIDRSEQADFIYHQIYQKIKEEIFSRNLLPATNSHQNGSLPKH
ncbi:HTH-type transcriptional regulatory protein GabR [Bacillus sonorensis]|uniref:HTH-type transcriptional regulatory protein GabR n=1 Tax=Bacillus sonorensis TaxID=119858 RepID=A0ABN5ANI9_9BACI|nr:HTH-type transcriptional regulatory protein GabR [Bacillus sonorensis]